MIAPHRPTGTHVEESNAQIWSLQREILSAHRRIRQLTERAQEAYASSFPGRPPIDRARRRESLFSQIDEVASLTAAIDRMREEAEAKGDTIGQEHRGVASPALASTGDRRPPATWAFAACPIGEGYIVTDIFGAAHRVGHLHHGIDILAPIGTQVRAPFDVQHCLVRSAADCV
jgi:murein DD-endopeptidase MepM/ murein hydrolase activator NlpD